MWSCCLRRGITFVPFVSPTGTVNSRIWRSPLAWTTPDSPIDSRTGMWMCPILSLGLTTIAAYSVLGVCEFVMKLKVPMYGTWPNAVNTVLLCRDCISLGGKSRLVRPVGSVSMLARREPFSVRGVRLGRRNAIAPSWNF
jgi:hypothetical protein